MGIAGRALALDFIWIGVGKETCADLPTSCFRQAHAIVHASRVTTTSDLIVCSKCGGASVVGIGSSTHGDSIHGLTIQTDIPSRVVRFTFSRIKAQAGPTLVRYIGRSAQNQRVHGGTHFSGKGGACAVGMVTSAHAVMRVNHSGRLVGGGHGANDGTRAIGIVVSSHASMRTNSSRLIGGGGHGSCSAPGIGLGFLVSLSEHVNACTKVTAFHTSFRSWMQATSGKTSRKVTARIAKIFMVVNSFGYSSSTVFALVLIHLSKLWLVASLAKEDCD
jgi:hypothetical protein